MLAFLFPVKNLALFPPKKKLILKIGRDLLPRVRPRHALHLRQGGHRSLRRVQRREGLRRGAEPDAGKLVLGGGTSVIKTFYSHSGNTKGGCITLLLTSCLTGLETA
jgi:hypothetical protein